MNTGMAWWCGTWWKYSGGDQETGGKQTPSKTSLAGGKKNRQEEARMAAGTAWQAFLGRLSLLLPIKTRQNKMAWHGSFWENLYILYKCISRKRYSSSATYVSLSSPSLYYVSIEKEGMGMGGEEEAEKENASWENLNGMGGWEGGKGHGGGTGRTVVAWGRGVCK